MKIIIKRKQDERQSAIVDIDLSTCTYPYAIRESLELALQLDGYDEGTIKAVFNQEEVITGIDSEFEPAKMLDPFEGAPEWARFRVADMARKEFWASKKPYPYDYGAWYGENCMFQECHDRRLTYSDWKVSLVEKTNK